MAYSDAFRTEALIRLAANKYDYEETAGELEVAESTLRAWERQYPQATVPELLDRALAHLLANIPDQWEAKDWAVAIGILLDKYQLLQGEPTERVETLLHRIGIDDPDFERDVLEEIDSILARVGSRGDPESGTANGRPASGEAETS